MLNSRYKVEKAGNQDGEGCRRVDGYANLYTKTDRKTKGRRLYLVI